MFFLPFVVSLLLFVNQCQAICQDYQHTCVATIGQIIHNGNQQPINLSDQDAYYLNFPITSITSDFYLDFTMYFGDIDIYLKRNDEPTLLSYDYSNHGIENKYFLHIKTTTANPFAVNDQINVLIRSSSGIASFFVLASLNNNPLDLNKIALIPGYPISFQLLDQSTKQFTTNVQSTDPSQLLLASSDSWIPNLTLQLPSQAQVIHNNLQSPVISYQPTSADIQKLGSITLQSPNNSIITIVNQESVATDQFPIHLLNGLKLQTHVIEGQSQYFIFHVPSSNTSKITINVQSFDGDVDLFVNPSSKGFYHREYSDVMAQWVSQVATGMDSVTILPTDSHKSNTYFISIYGYIASQVLIQAFSDTSVTTLTEGISIHDSVLTGKYRYYSFLDVSLTRSLVFDILRIQGNPKVYVACQLALTYTDAGIPSRLPNHYNYTVSDSYLDASLEIAASDSASCAYQALQHNQTSTNVYIAVYGEADSSYSITAMHVGGIRTVRDGELIQGTIFKHETDVYKIYIGMEATDLDITLTPMTGDVDLYVKMNGDASMYNYDYRSVAMGSNIDRISISEETICTKCWIQIAVYSFESAQYTLVAKTFDGSIDLVNGLPLRGSVSADGIQYYTYQSSHLCSIQVVLTIFNGQYPSLYLSKSVSKPTSTSIDTIRQRRSDVDINVPMLFFPQLNPGDILNIGVDGDGINSSYSVRASEVPLSSDTTSYPTLLTLIEGLPQMETITYTHEGEKGWLYYGIQVLAGHETIKLRTQSLGGDFGVYITRCTLPSIAACEAHFLPNETYYQLSSDDSSEDIISIYRTDSNTTLYMVGITTYNYYTSYQISYTFQHTILELQAGIQVFDHVSPQEIDYFAFYFPISSNNQKIKIVLTPISGDPDLYVSVDNQHPSNVNNTWKSFSFGSDIIEIDPSKDRKACVQCTYYIAVVGSTESSYSIHIDLDYIYPHLISGMPMTTSVDLLSWKYFLFDNYMIDQRDIHITLQSLTGNADVYVSLDHQLPDFGHYDYESDNFYTNDEILIVTTDSKLTRCLSKNNGVCPMIIGVFGLVASEFVITATTAMHATVIPMGTTRQDTVLTNKNNLYKMTYSQHNTIANYLLQVFITPVSGHVSAYLTCNNDNIPTRNHSTWSSTNIASNTPVVIQSLDARDKNCLLSSGVYYVNVYGDTNAQYTIQWNVQSNATSVRYLSLQHAISGSLASYHMDYYYVYNLPDVIDDFTFQLTVLSGDADVYLSGSWDQRPVYDPNTDRVIRYTLKSEELGSDLLTLTHDQAQDLCANQQKSSSSTNDNDCYLIVGVFSSYTGASNSVYSLLFNAIDSIQPLYNGLPVYGHAKQNRYQYYHFQLMSIAMDVEFALTALSGDPDLFVGVRPITHPNRHNFTWTQSSIGGDTLVLQSNQLAQYCPPVTSTGINKEYRPCDLYIGVFGWKNTSYMLSAHVLDGFLSPLILQETAPQLGTVNISEYKYFQFQARVEPPSKLSKDPPIAVKFTLTPTNGGDLDLYLVIANNKSAPRSSLEPGKTHFDYKSNGWSNVVEIIEVKQGMKLYCIDCVYYLAVFGYSAGSFSLQASSTGLTRLQSDSPIGGVVSDGEFTYYTYYNEDSFAVMTFALTAIFGDSDLYINKRTSDSTDFVFPTKTSSDWHSLSYGSDTLSITYEDPKFCVNCEYVIGVYGYRNATYTLSLSSHEASIIHISPNRPQRSSLTMGKLQYFSIKLLDTSMDLSIALTSLDSGVADLYIQMYNTTEFNSAGGGDRLLLPTPSDPSTYTYTNANSEDDHIYIPGPIEGEIIVIGVYARSTIHFSLTVAGQDRPIYLQTGYPQNHYVDFQQNEVFVVYPDDLDADLRISVTARSGDPDLFVSVTNTFPHCVAGVNSWDVHCYNYTWASRMFNTDQIIISRDYPCESILPSTNIDSNCRDGQVLAALHAYPVQPLYIAIYGYKASQFSILVADIGQHTRLLSGQPQQSSTFPSMVCSKRDESSSGCADDSEIAKRVQISYFSYQFSYSKPSNPQDSIANMFEYLMFSVVPQCNDTHPARVNATAYSPATSTGLRSEYIRKDDWDTVCQAGCRCDPLVLYISSCKASECTEDHRKPNDILGHYQANFTVLDASDSTIYITPDSPAYCDPQAAQEDCIYYISVMHKKNIDTSAVFTITGRTSKDIYLIACDSNVYPDGIRFSSIDMIASHVNQPTSLNYQHFYEVCNPQATNKLSRALIASSSSSSSAKYTSSSPQVTSSSAATSKGIVPLGQTSGMLVELEQCSGQTTLFACRDSRSSTSTNDHCKAMLPTLTDWDYYADTEMTCSRIKGDRLQCITESKKDYRSQLPLLPSDVNNVGNYYLMANGTGTFKLQVRTAIAGVDLSPQVSINGVPDIAIVSTTASSLTLQWESSRVDFPGLTTSKLAPEMIYSVYAIPEETYESIQSTQSTYHHTHCGISSLISSYLSSFHQGHIKQSQFSSLSANDPSPRITYTLPGLVPNTLYRVFIIATCDGQCLRQLSKTLLDSAKSLVDCNQNKHDCKAQYLMYNTHILATNKGKISSNDDDASNASIPPSWLSTLIAAAFILIVLIFLFVLGTTGYLYAQNPQDFSLLRDMPTFITHLFQSSSSSSSSGSNNSSGKFSQGAEMIDIKRFSKLPTNSSHGFTDEDEDVSVDFNSVQARVQAQNTSTSWFTSMQTWVGDLFAPSNPNLTGRRSDPLVKINAKQLYNPPSSSSNSRGGYEPVSLNTSTHNPFIVSDDLDEEISVQL